MVGDFFVRTLFLDIEQRSASSKTCFDPVPIADGRFIPLPAQIYHFGTQQAREIDQTLFRSLADATVTLDLFHPIFDFRHEPSYLIILLQSVHEIRGPWIELLIANDYLALVFQPLNIFLDPLHQYTHSGQQSISFIHRKESRKRDRGGDHTYGWRVFVVTALESTGCQSLLKTHTVTEFLQQGDVVGVARHMSDDCASNRFPQQVKVPHDVKNLVARQLVGKAQIR